MMTSFCSAGICIFEDIMQIVTLVFKQFLKAGNYWHQKTESGTMIRIINKLIIVVIDKSVDEKSTFSMLDINPY